MAATYFVQECPTCGRHVRIKAEYLGRRMSCLHCEGEFTAADRESRFDAVESRDSGLPVLESMLRIAQPVMATPTH